MKTIAQRVQAGIKFLDKKYGKKWRKKIRLRTLDLADNNCCPLGQTDSNYFSHKDALGLSNRDSYNLGFHIWPYYRIYDIARRPIWNRLTSAWKKALKGKVGRNA